MAVFFITLIILFLAFSFKKSRVLNVCMFLFAWIIFSYSINVADREVYKMKYINYDKWSSATEFLFNKIMTVSNGWGLEFQTFITIIGLIFLLILFVTAYRLSDNFCLVIALYFLFPFVMDVVQIRFFLASVIIIFGFQFIFKENVSVKDNILWCICVIVAASFHLSAILFLSFVILEKINLKKCIYIIIS